MAKKNTSIVRGTALVLIVATLPGCFPLTTPTLVGLAVDGVSYMASGKSVTDHAISGLAQRDCSVGRAVLTNTNLCRGEASPMVLIAEKTEPLSENIELAALSDESDNPLFSTQHPSRWPSIPQIQ